MADRSVVSRMPTSVWAWVKAALRGDDSLDLANWPEHGQFPGRWLGVISLVVSPTLLLVGELFKAPYHYYFPEQLQAYAAHSGQVTAGYVLWSVGWLAMWPAFLTLAASITRTRPILGRVAGSLAIIGLLVNLFYEGISHLTFKLADVHGVPLATHFVDQTYAWPSVVWPALTWTDNLAWIVLGVGCYLAGTLGWVRGLCIAVMAAHASGVLKGFTPEGVAYDLLLCFAFITLGIELARRRRMLSAAGPGHDTSSTPACASRPPLDPS